MAKKNIVPGQHFKVGGIDWTVLEVEELGALCISTHIIDRSAFDTLSFRNDLRSATVANDVYSHVTAALEREGSPDELLRVLCVDLTGEDGLEDYEAFYSRVGLLTCNQYRRLRRFIPPVKDIWWTATPSSPVENAVEAIGLDGTLQRRRTVTVCGLRPTVRFDRTALSELFDRKSDEDHQKEMRGHALDMVHHLIAAWDLIADEVFPV